MGPVCLPQILFRWLPEAHRLPVNAAVTSGLLLAAMPRLSRIPHVCLVRLLFHRPCPGCGITSSLLALRRFDLAGAWKANPAGVGVGVLLAGQLLVAPLNALLPDSGLRRLRASANVIARVTVLSMVATWVSRLLFPEHSWL